MTSLRVNTGSFPLIVRLPGSKSYANRILILASLRPGNFTISDMPQSSDVTTLISALEQCGLAVSSKESTLTIHNSFPACEGTGEIEVNIGEGGTTARFLASMLLLGKREYTLILGERLRERPWEEFIHFVRLYGGKVELKGSRLKLQGPLNLPVKVEIDCTRTTQFASGIRLAYAWKGTEVDPVMMDSSQSYWEMTEEMMRTAKDVNHFKVPLDWSSASYPLAFAALNHPIYFPGLSYDNLQSDAKFMHLLSSFSALKIEESGLSIIPVTEHKAVSMDVSDCLDLVPALSFFLSHIKGRHELKGIKNLVYKESDRLIEIRELLQLFGRETTVEDDSLFIQGDDRKVSKSLDLMFPDDHRMVMAGALFLRHHAGGTVSPAEAVNKSYSEFFTLLS